MRKDRKSSISIYVIFRDDLPQAEIVRPHFRSSRSNSENVETSKIVFIRETFDSKRSTLEQRRLKRPKAPSL